MKNGALTPGALRAAQGVLAGLTALFSGFVAWAFTCDDAAITYQFAAQAAAGHPLGTVTPGDPIVSGFSNPSWTLGLAGLAKLGLPIAGSAKVAGVLCGMLTAVCAARLAGRLGRARWTGWAGCAVGASTTLAIWSVSGLETAFVAFLVMLTALLLVGEEQDERQGWKAHGSSVALAVLVVSRPDAFTFLGVAAVARAVSRRRTGAAWRSVATDLLRWGTFPAATLAGWWLFSLRRFGHVLPNPVFAKVQHTMFDRVLALFDLGAGPLSVTFRFLAATASILLVPLAFFVWRQRRGPTATVLWLALGALVLPFSEIDWMADFRFYTVATPLLVVLAVLGIDAIDQRAENALATAATVRTVRPSLLLGAVVIAWAGLNVLQTVDSARNEFPGQVTVARVRSATAPLAGVARNRGLHDPLVMTADAGATVDDLDLRILDLAGLLDPQISHLMDDPEARAQYAFTERRPELVRAGTPEWSWNQLWGLSPSAMAAHGYLRLPDIEEPAYIRRDLVVRPVSSSASSSRSGIQLDRIDMPTAADGGEIVAQVWLAGRPVDDAVDVTVQMVLRRADGAVVSKQRVPLGDGLVAPSRWRADEAVAHAFRLPIPNGSGRIRLNVALEDGEQRTILGSADLEQGPVAMDRAQQALVERSVTNPQTAMATLDGLARLAAAAPTSGDRFEKTAEGVRRRAEIAVEKQIRAAAASSDWSDLEDARRLLVPIRGRVDVGSRARDLGRWLRQEAARSAPEGRYRLLVASTTVDPTSASAQADLLAARPARPPSAG